MLIQGTVEGYFLRDLKEIEAEPIGRIALDVGAKWVARVYA